MYWDINLSWSLQVYVFNYPHFMKSVFFFSGNSQYNQFMKKNRSLLQDNKCIYFNIDINHLGYLSEFNNSTTLYVSILKLVPPINYICLHDFWSMENLKSQYFYHKMAGKKICVCDVTGINHFKYDFYVWCFVIQTKRVSTCLNTTSETLFLMDVVFRILCLLLLNF